MSTAKDLGLVTAYAYAVSKGYEGTEEEFAALMASYATVAEEAEGYAEQAEAAKDLAESARNQAEEWASGSVGGDPSETNNAKYYSEQAADQASEAARQAGLADASAIAAGASEGAAAGSASTASTKAGEAAASATAAAGSATTASTKATEAAGSATQANTAKTAAQAAQTAAETAQGKAEDAQEAAEAAAEQAEATLNSYAKVDGSYSSMTVGNAEQLVATVAVEDSVPYNFRTSGGTADIGDREVDKIVGGTVAWNQLAPNTSETGSITISFTQGTAVGTGHKVLFSANRDIDTEKIILTFYGRENGTNQPVTVLNMPIGGAKHMETVFNVPLGGVSTGTAAATNGNIWLYIGSTSVNTVISGMQMFDLTQMFGTTIADYIYSLETATPGAGVAWFRKLFPKPYYAYNPGELMSVQAAAHKMVEFNAWDEEWERNGYSINNGQPVSTNGIRSKNYNLCLPNTAYYVLGATYILWYDASKAYLGYDNAGLRVSPASARYFRLRQDGDITYRNDICINLSWDGERDGEYEPYQEWDYPLDNSLTLRGIPKLDSGNALYYDGDTYESDGTVTRRYNYLEFDGSPDESWNLQSINSAGIANFGIAVPFYDTALIDNGSISNRFSRQTTLISNTTTEGYMFAGSATLYICIDSTKADTVAALRTWLASNPTAFVYVLATPTTEEADPYQSPQIVDDFGTEEYVDAGVATETRDVAIPVGHNTFYQANLRAKLEMSPDSPDGDGDYIVRQTNGTNAYVPLVIPQELPTAPTTEGTYHLKATVTSGGVTLTWEADT